MRNTAVLAFPKLTKKEAYKLVLDLDIGVPLPRTYYDRLLNYLTPPPPKIAKTAFEWVAKAAGRGDEREYVNVVHVGKRIAAASDGVRIHWAPSDLIDGVYDPLTGARYTMLSHSDHASNFYEAMERVGMKKPAGVLQSISPFFDLASVPLRLKPTLRINDRYALDVGYLLEAFNTESLTSAPGDWSEADTGFSGKSEFGDFKIMAITL